VLVALKAAVAKSSRTDSSKFLIVDGLGAIDTEAQQCRRKRRGSKPGRPKWWERGEKLGEWHSWL